MMYSKKALLGEVLVLSILIVVTIIIFLFFGNAVKVQVGNVEYYLSTRQDLFAWQFLQIILHLPSCNSGNVLDITSCSPSYIYDLLSKLNSFFQGEYKGLKEIYFDEISFFSCEDGKECKVYRAPLHAKSEMKKYDLDTLMNKANYKFIITSNNIDVKRDYEKDKHIVLIYYFKQHDFGFLIHLNFDVKR